MLTKDANGKHKNEMKTVYTTNGAKRDEFIDKFGQKEFDKICKVDPEWAKLQDIPVPDHYRWLFNHFLTIWKTCAIDMNGNRIFRPVEIINYCNCLGINMTYYERHLLLLMKVWACEVIYELENKKKED